MKLLSKLTLILTPFTLLLLSTSGDSTADTQSNFNKKYQCKTESNGIQGCWAVGCFDSYEGMSVFYIAEFTENKLLVHENMYTGKSCADSPFVYSNIKPIDDEFSGAIYQTGTREVAQGQNRIEYDDFTFSFTHEWVEDGGEMFIRDVDGAIAYHLKGGKLCVKPSQVNDLEGFVISSDDMLDLYVEKDYFFDGQHIRDMSTCLKAY